MSSPYSDDLGDWQSLDLFGGIPRLVENHQEFLDELEPLTSIERDRAFTSRAIDNIIHNPQKFAQNWVANIGRLLFNYPYSYTEQKLSIFYYLIPNIFLVVVGILCIYPVYVCRKRIPYELWVLGTFGLIGFSGSTLLSAYGRMFIPFAPILVLWIIFTLIRVVKIEIREIEDV